MRTDTNNVNDRILDAVMALLIKMGARLDAIETLEAAAHDVLSAQHTAHQALEERLVLLEEWARLRFEELRKP